MDTDMMDDVGGAQAGPGPQSMANIAANHHHLTSPPPTSARAIPSPNGGGPGSSGSRFGFASPTSSNGGVGGGGGGSGSGGGMSALSALMRNGGGGPGSADSFPAQPQNSPTFPSQLSPYSQPFQLPYGSFGMGMSLTNFGTGMGTSYLGPSGGGSSNLLGVGGASVSGGGGPHHHGGGGGMSLGMSISPNYQHALHAMSQGSLQAASSLHNNAAGVGAERSRELEAKFVKDFTCCGLRLNGLHDLLEHYEECHVHLAPELKKQSSLLAKQEPPSAGGGAAAATATGDSANPPASFPSSAAPSPFNVNAPVPPPQMAGLSSVPPPSLTKQASPADSDAPGTPGVMEMDMMDDDDDMAVDSAPLRVLPSILPPTSAQWSSYQTPNAVPQCVPPSLLSYAIPNSNASTPNMSGFGFPGGEKRGTTGGAGGGSHGFLTDEQKAERARRKAARKEAKRIARENGEESSDDGRDADGFKRYRCPVEGCSKSYKQANGLKYHLNRSINSSHGNLKVLPSYLFKSDKE